MENASKALIMAGEVLIGILILSLASYLVMSFGNFSKHLNTQMSESQITSFNVRFTNYSGRANISAQEIATIVNFVKQNNAEYEASPGDDYYADVLIDGKSILHNDLNAYLDNNKNSIFYSCNCDIKVKSIDDTNEKIILSKYDRIDNRDILYNDNTSLVTSINFRSITDQNYATALLKGYNLEIP